ncbi:MAG TPA: hypothetical protein VLK33_04005 [Terriglobales bacterium]|nr:hypothetical protein [Terriglobales bacterium]
MEYIEPSGRTLTFDAYWRSPQKDRTVVLDVAFPAELAVPENDEPRKHEAIERLGIPKTPSVQTQIPSTRRDEIKDRVSRGLKKLTIAHAFVSPQRFGWTSFEDGKEIYHG